VAIRVPPAVETIRKITPDDVWQLLIDGHLDPDRNYELDDGELVEVPPAAGDHSSSSLDIAAEFQRFTKATGGRAFDSSAGFLVGADLKQLRSPDAAYIGPARAQPSYPGWIVGAPDVAVEVLSPDQHTERYARSRVREYFAAGAQFVWLVDAIKKEIHVYRPGVDSHTVYRRDAVITLEPFLQGFALRVSDIFV
jgi:Uma2 family endonuclease